MLSLVAFAIQAAYATSIHQPQSTANLIVPPSTVLYWYEGGNFCSTQYLKWIGPTHGGGPVEPLVDAYGPLVRQGQPSGYSPAQLHAAYNVPPNLGTQAIAIVDAYDLPNAITDFNTFSAQYGLPQETSTDSTASTNKVFQVVYAQGAQPGSAVPPGWNTEEDLDIEWAHAMAPNAKIYLVETTDNSDVNLYPGDQVAAALAKVKEVSNSWGGPEYSTETQDDHYFAFPGVTFYHGSGDTGGAITYPSHSPNVISCGGTTLIMNGLSFVSESVWGDNPRNPTAGTGGGPSAFEPRPAFQSAIVGLTGAFRGNPDISSSADPEYGAAVFSTADGGWEVIGGTSWATPTMAGIVNAGAYFVANSQAENTLFYSLLGTNRIRDIVTGGVDGDNVYRALVGWDFCTGVGTPLDIGRPPIVDNEIPDQVSEITGTYVSGNLASLAAIDGNDYVETGATFSGLGSTADIRAHFTVTNAQPANTISATFTVTAKSNYAQVINQIFLYNTRTKVYDLYATPLLTSTAATFSVQLTGTQAENYIDGSGNVVMLTRALLPQSQFSGSNSKFTYSVDQMTASYTFLSPSPAGPGGGGPIG